MADALAATPAVDTGAPVAEANPNVLIFTIPNSNPETQLSVDLGTIPGELRLSMLKDAVKAYISNSVNQANVRANKANAAFTAYDEATKADPLQTAVPAPTGERVDPKLNDVAVEARKRLYENKVRKQGESTGTPRVAKDPLIKMVTDAVTRELFDKKKASTPGYKWTDAVKEVSGDGVAYLDARIAEQVANGADAAVLNKFKDSKYITPAKMMLGQTTTKATADQSLLG